MFGKFIKSGERIPFPYGLSYRVCMRDGAMCHPVPFNRIIRWAVNFWWWIAMPRKLSGRESLDACLAYTKAVERENELLRTKLDVEAEGRESVERSYVRAVALNENLRTELNKFLSVERTA